MDFYTLEQKFQRINSIALGIASVILSVSFIIVVVQVFARYIFKTGFFWGEELARYLLIYMVMLCSGYLLRNNENPYVEILYNSLSRRWKFWVNLLMYILITSFLIFLLVNGMNAVESSVNRRTASLRIIWSIPYSAIPVGAFLMLLQMPYLFMKNFSENFRSSQSRHEHKE